MPEIIFNGPNGRIEGRYVTSKNYNAPIILFLHPHPEYGGTMNNKVIYSMYHTFANKGFSCLRFNFRGTGKSKGEFSDGIGELSDAACALNWLRTQYKSASQVWVAGFSFGAWIALQLLMRRPEIDRFIAVSPPLHKYDLSFLSPCPSDGLIIQGENDSIVPVEKVDKLYDKIKIQKNINISYERLEGVDHFFKNKEHLLVSILKEYIDNNIKNNDFDLPI